MNITVYGATWCAFCKTEKQWLDSKNVSYNYIDVDVDEDAMKTVEELTNSRAVPITVVNSGNTQNVIKGFNRQALQEAIGI